MVVPKSGCTTMNPPNVAVNRAGVIRSRKVYWPESFPDSKYFARTMTMAILANSETWILIEPIYIQRYDPEATTPLIRTYPSPIIVNA